MRRPSDSVRRWSNPVSGSGARVAVPPPDETSSDETSLVIGTSRSVKRRSPAGAVHAPAGREPSAPAVLLAEGGVLGLDPGLRCVGDQVDPGVHERLTLGGLGLGAVLRELG